VRPSEAPTRGIQRRIHGCVFTFRVCGSWQERIGMGCRMSRRPWRVVVRRWGERPWSANSPPGLRLVADRPTPRDGGGPRTIAEIGRSTRSARSLSDRPQRLPDRVSPPAVQHDKPSEAVSVGNGQLAEAVTEGGRVKKISMVDVEHRTAHV